MNRRVVLTLNELTPKKRRDDLSKEMRANWNFNEGLQNKSVLGTRIDAESHGGASIEPTQQARGSAVRFRRSQGQYLNVPKSFLDDNSAAHTVSLWFKPASLPPHGTGERSFLLESTAQGKTSNPQAGAVIGSGITANSLKSIWSYRKSVLSSAKVKPASV